MLLKVQFGLVPSRFKINLEPLDPVMIRPVYLIDRSSYESSVMQI